jgi:hypothetical protein
MRLKKISLKQLKSDLKKLYKKRKSRFGEDSPLGVTGQKVELKKKPSLKERLNKIPLKKIGTGLAVIGGVAAAAAGAHHVATKTEAGKAVTDAVSARVGYEKNKANEKINQVKAEAGHRIDAAKAQAEREHIEAMYKLNKAVGQRADIVSRDVENVAGDFHRAVGNVKVAGEQLKGKALEDWNKTNALTPAANQLASWIAPSGQRFGRTRFGNKFKELVKKHKKNLITAGKVAAVVGTTAAVAGAGVHMNKKRKAYEASPEGQEAKKKKEEEENKKKENKARIIRELEEAELHKVNAIKQQAAAQAAAYEAAARQQQAAHTAAQAAHAEAARQQAEAAAKKERIAATKTGLLSYAAKSKQNLEDEAKKYTTLEQQRAALKTKPELGAAFIKQNRERAKGTELSKAEELAELQRKVVYGDKAQPGLFNRSGQISEKQEKEAKAAANKAAEKEKQEALSNTATTNKIIADSYRQGAVALAKQKASDKANNAKIALEEKRVQDEIKVNELKAKQKEAHDLAIAQQKIAQDLAIAQQKIAQDRAKRQIEEANKKLKEQTDLARAQLKEAKEVKNNSPEELKKAKAKSRLNTIENLKNISPEQQQKNLNAAIAQWDFGRRRIQFGKRRRM